MREINDTIRYACGRCSARHPLGDDRRRSRPRVEALLARNRGEGVVVRGIYDVAGLRGDADFMIWWHAETIEHLQSAYHRLLRTELGQHLEPVWTRGAAPPGRVQQEPHPGVHGRRGRRTTYVCVYPFVRSYEWYLLEDGERRDLLREHGQMARDFPDVRANTIASFALGDYEWLLAFEADELHRIVDLMRDLRASRARMHVREEIPFFTGPRVEGRAVANLR